MDDGEDPAAAAAREVEEETGWCPRGIEFVMSSQPIIARGDILGAITIIGVQHALLRRVAARAPRP